MLTTSQTSWVLSALLVIAVHPYPAPFLQDVEIMSRISSYFNKPIDELKWDDEDEFVKVLEKTL